MTPTPFLHHLDQGAGPATLVILHGLFGTLDNWQTLARRWAEEAGLVMPGNPQTRAKIFLDALTGDMQLRCLLGLSSCPGKAAREHLISETTAIFINGLSTDRH